MGVKYLKRILIICVFTATALFVIVGIVSEFSEVSKSTNDRGRDKEITAMLCAQEAVEKNLTSPASAVFPNFDEHKIVWSGLRYRVEGYVDSDNDFGASLRNEYVVILEFKDDKAKAYYPRYVRIGDDVFLDRGE
jgi:hypothetical protein